MSTFKASESYVHSDPDLEVARDYHYHESRFTPEPTPQEADENDCLSAETILSMLTPKMRQVLELRAMAGLRHKEIGAIVWPDAQPHVATTRSECTYKRTLDRVRQLSATPAEVRNMKQEMEKRRAEASARRARKAAERHLGPALAGAILSALDTTRSGASHSI